MGEMTLVVAVTGDPVPEVEAERGDYVQIFADACGLPSAAVRGIDVREDELEVPTGAALLITGSAANVHARAPWMVRTEAALAGLVAQASVPILGVCFGHQLLAQALGGDVQPNPRGREIGTHPCQQVTDAGGLFDGLEPTFTMNACHSDTVTRLPPQSTVLARNGNDDHQALRMGKRCWSVQFHPEFDDFIMKGFVRARAAAMRDEGLDPVATEAAVTSTPSVQILRNFLRMANETNV